MCRVCIKKGYTMSDTLFQDILTQNSNVTKTENGQVCYNDTNNPLLDFYYKAVRLNPSYTKSQFLQDFKFSYSFDKVRTLVLLFNLRDITDGKGERDLFRFAMESLKTLDKTMYHKVVPLVPTYGRYDDLVFLNEIDFLASQLRQDIISVEKNEAPSLCAKWLPSHTSKKYKQQKSALLKALGINEKKYRGILKNLRQKLDIIEYKLTNKQYDSIDYSKVPSQAMNKYKKSFYKNDENRFSKYVENLTKDDKTQKTKVNVNTLYPHDLATSSYSNQTEKDLLISQWETLKKKYSEYGLDKVLVAADVSGSMNGLPMQVSVGLAIFISELQNSKDFKNMVCLFSERGEFYKLRHDNPYDNYKSLVNYSNLSACNTNFISVFTSLLNLAKQNNIPQDKMPESVVIISDMQFDSSGDKKVMDQLRQMYDEHNYKLPKLVYWNVRTSVGAPSYDHDRGVLLLSGYSPSILKQVLQINDWSPIKIVDELVNSDRYKPVLERIS